MIHAHDNFPGLSRESKGLKKFGQVMVMATALTVGAGLVRAATVVGFFGAGGMGWYLKRNVLQIETNRVAAILLSIIALVLVSEAASAWARARVAKAK